MFMYCQLLKLLKVILVGRHSFVDSVTQVQSHLAACFHVILLLLPNAVAIQCESRRMYFFCTCNNNNFDATKIEIQYSLHNENL